MQKDEKLAAIACNGTRPLRLKRPKMPQLHHPSLNLAHQTMDAEAELLTAIAHAYRAFDKYRLIGAIDVCQCELCLGNDSERRLLNTPLAAIDAELLACYSHAAKPADPISISLALRYFLPRYFELIAKNEWPVHYNEEGSLKMLRQAEYRRTWPAAEVEAVEGLFGALFRASLQRNVSINDPQQARLERCAIGLILGLIVCAGGDVAPRLRDWESADQPTADLHLALFIERNRPALVKRKHLNVAWRSAHPDVESQIILWLLRPETIVRMEAAFTREGNRVNQAILSDAHSLVSSLVR